MDTGTQYTFRLNAYTLGVTPASRLAGYLLELLPPFGNARHMHLDCETKSRCIVDARVDNEDVPKVEAHAHLVGRIDAPADIEKPCGVLIRMLREDGIDSSLAGEGSGWQTLRPPQAAWRELQGVFVKGPQLFPH